MTRAIPLLAMMNPLDLNDLRYMQFADDAGYCLDAPSVLPAGSMYGFAPSIYRQHPQKRIFFRDGDF